MHIVIPISHSWAQSPKIKLIFFYYELETRKVVRKNFVGWISWILFAISSISSFGSFIFDNYSTQEASLELLEDFLKLDGELNIYHYTKQPDNDSLNRILWFDGHQKEEKEAISSDYPSILNQIKYHIIIS